MRIATAAALLAACAGGPIHAHSLSAARPAAPGVTIHRGEGSQHGRWHHWPDASEAPELDHGWGGGASRFGSGWTVYAPATGSGQAGLEADESGFFPGGQVRMSGHRVVYEYDRGYPYEHYRYRSSSGERR